MSIRWTQLAIDVTSVTLSRLNSINAIDVTGYVGDILGIFLGYFWNIFGIFLGYLWDIFGISLGNLWDIFAIAIVLTFAAASVS